VLTPCLLRFSAIRGKNGIGKFCRYSIPTKRVILTLMRLFLLVLTFLVFHLSHAHAFEITALGGANFSNPTETNANGKMDWTGNSAFSYGASVTVSLFTTPFDLEAGVFYLASEVAGKVSNVDLIRRQHALHLPVLIRYNFDPWVSLALGGYYSSGKGSVEDVTGGVTSRQTYAAAGLLPDDIGLIFGMKAKIHLSREVSLVIDGRYQHGLRNLASNSAYVYNTRSIQGFTGLGFDF
jgi:hypothetical protein